MHYGGFSKTSTFAGVVSAVEVGFDYWRLACITGDFLKVLNLRVVALPSRVALIIGAWFVVRGSGYKF